MNNQEMLAALFAEVLGKEHVAPDEDFFDLGGDSIAATRLVNRIYSSLGIPIPVQAIFDAPTILGVADQVRRLQGNS